MSMKKLGRPRDEITHKKILRTAITLLLENGYRETTMKDISLKARVSKQTIYRWWNNRAELLMEAFAFYSAEKIPFPDAASEDENLLEFIKKTFSTAEARILLKTLLAESLMDEEFGRTFFEKFILQRQTFLAEKLKLLPQLKSQNQETVDAMVDLIFGAMWYRLIFAHRPLDAAFAEQISAIVFNIDPKHKS
jgi:AcrR family transcriptional regulator